MNLRTIKRRDLCKTIVALALAAIVSPLRSTAAEPMASPASKHEPVKRMQKDQKKFFMCILRRQPRDECVTVLRASAGQANRAGITMMTGDVPSDVKHLLTFGSAKRWLA